MAQLFLWLVSFAVGGAVMVIELTGARILAPTFGFSVVPWTAVIAAVLMGVAAGNAWGGRRSRAAGLADLRGLLVLAAISVLLPLIRMDLPDLLFRHLGMVFGSLASAGILLIPASFLLGAVVPVLVRMATTDVAEVGRRSGSLNGANALGAILGTLLTGFVLIPLVPVSRILLITTGVLLLGAVVIRRIDLPAAPRPATVPPPAASPSAALSHAAMPDGAHGTRGTRGAPGAPEFP